MQATKFQLIVDHSGYLLLKTFITDQKSVTDKILRIDWVTIPDDLKSKTSNRSELVLAEFNKDTVNDIFEAVRNPAKVAAPVAINTQVEVGTAPSCGCKSCKCDETEKGEKDESEDVNDDAGEVSESAPVSEDAKPEEKQEQPKRGAGRPKKSDKDSK